jgi:tetratricopeptide (TPR) repeat protein
MKTTMFAAWLAVLPISVHAQDPAEPQPFQTPVLLIRADEPPLKVWAVAATRSQIRYRETEVAVDTVDARISEFQAIYQFEPAEFSAAMDLYQGRKYSEAKEKFIAVKEQFKPMNQMADNYSTLAAFYELECLRRLGDLEGLSAALQKFIKDPISQETRLRQLELYVIWDAVRTKSWDRVNTMCSERQNTKLPGDQRAQVAYCHGLALEGLNRPQEALVAYQTAMTADAGTTEEVARQAALQVLGIFKNDAAVQNAMKLWGTPDENKNSKAHSDLMEAAAVAKLFEMSLGAGQPLPADYKPFLKFQAKPAN